MVGGRVSSAGATPAIPTARPLPARMSNVLDSTRVLCHVVSSYPRFIVRDLKAMISDDQNGQDDMHTRAQARG